MANDGYLPVRSSGSDDIEEVFDVGSHREGTLLASRALVTTPVVGDDARSLETSGYPRETSPAVEGPVDAYDKVGFFIEGP